MLPVWAAAGREGKLVMADRDIYAGLRPPDPTPPNEICACSGDKPIKLMYALSFNPVNCIDCNLEVPPERLGFDRETAQGVVYWRAMCEAIEFLWRDSGSYEAWARQQLSDINSPVNTLGRKVQQDLNKIHRCYYQYFQGAEGDEIPFSMCPACGGPLEEYAYGRSKSLLAKLCEKCSIIGVAEEET